MISKVLCQFALALLSYTGASQREQPHLHHVTGKKRCKALRQDQITALRTSVSLLASSHVNNT